MIADLYHHELRLYKNFFQPVMKLAAKTRRQGKIHKTYDAPRTPYQRLMESTNLTQEAKRTLQKLYDDLNPAALKREIDARLEELYRTYQQKNGSPKIEASRVTNKKLVPSLVSLSIGQPM